MKPELKAKYGCMEEFLHEKRSAMRIIDGNERVIEGTYLDCEEQCFMSIVDDRYKKHELPARTKVMIWHRTKWISTGFQRRTNLGLL